MTSEGRGAEGASNSSSFTGTKAGAIVSGDPAAPGFSFAAPRRRSRQPSQERRIHLKNEIGVQPMPTRNRGNRSPRSESLLDDPLALIEPSRRSPPLPSFVFRRHRCPPRIRVDT
jgi:hypothetical protein